MYNTRHRRDGGGGADEMMWSIDHKNAASVLPDPVGAWINVCWPVAIDAQP
jgi:hypothetical protein